MRYIFLLIIIGASIGVFVTLINPRYQEIKAMRKDVASYAARLETAQKLKLSREELIARYNSIPKADLDNLKILLPDSVDNIRLIIQLDSLATKNGLSSLRSVQYDAAKTDPSTKTVETTSGPQRPYGEFNMSFETTGQYKNFLSFISDLEQNLRLVDISTVTFSPAVNDRGLSDSIKYSVTLKTYWLKK
jgi:Tfp pilus assembly protein PilO